MNSDSPGPPLRILLALDYERDPEALEAAAQLAEVLKASLEALFVEDDSLLRLAGLPFAQEIGIGSAAIRRMELGRLKRELHRRATELQTALAQRAQRSQLQWTFTTIRGALPAVALNTTADLYVLPRRGRGYPAPPRQIPGPIVVLYDGSAPAGRALDAASSLVDGVPLLLLVTPAATPERLRQVLSTLEARGRAAMLLPLGAADATEVAAHVRRHRAGLLVLGAGSIRPAELERLLETTDTPTLIAR